MRVGRTQYGEYFRVRLVFIGPLCPVVDLTDVRLIKLALFYSLESRQLVLSSNWSEGVVEETLTSR